MLIKTLSPLTIQIGTASTEIPAGDIERVPIPVGKALVNAGHATRALEPVARWAGDKPAAVTVTDISLEDASTFGNSVRVACNRRVIATTHTIGESPSLANVRDLIRLTSRAEWVPQTVADAIVAAGAGERVPWWVEKADTYDHTAAPVEVSVEDTPTDPHRANLGNDAGSSVHPWTAGNGEYI